MAMDSPSTWNSKSSLEDDDKERRARMDTMSTVSDEDKPSRQQQQQQQQTSSQTLSKHSSEAKSKAALSERWTQLIERIHIPILKFLHWLSSSTGVRHPKTTMLVVVLLSIGLFATGYFTNFTVRKDEGVWLPTGSPTYRHKAWIQQKSGFGDPARPLVMFLHANGDNVLGIPQVRKLFTALDTVRNLNQNLQDYESICFPSQYRDASTPITCPLSALTAFWGHSIEQFNATVQTEQDLLQAVSASSYPDGSPVADKDVMGHAQRNGTMLYSAQSFIVYIGLPANDVSEAFEAQALDAILDLDAAWQVDPDTGMRVEILAERSYDDEFSRAVVNDIPLVPLVFAFMAVFTSLVFWKRDPVQSRSLLGFLAVLSVLLSIVSGYGLLFLAGVPFTSMTPLLPFVLFGIGLDDVFIVAGAFDRTNPVYDVEERIRQTIDDVGISITVSTTTTVFAFGIGAISTVPTVTWLCLYAFPTIIIIYLYQLTFFVACLVLDERRVQAKRRDCCIWIAVATDEEEVDQEQVPVEPEVQKTGHTERFMLRYADYLLRPWCRFVVIVAFAALLVACAISTTKLKQEFDLTTVFPKDSYVTDYLDAANAYAERSSTSPHVYFRFVNQSVADIQDQMEQYVNELVEIPAIAEEPDHFWLRDFKKFQNESDKETALLTFNEQLDLFLSDPMYRLYNDDIARDGNGSITSSRCLVHMDHVNLNDVTNQIEALTDQRRVTSAQPINKAVKEWAFFTYEGLYDLWELYYVMIDELILSTMIGVIAVAVVALFLLPHWTAALFVLPFITILYFELLGVLQWCGVKVNVVTFIVMVMSIGLLVDFIMHILLRYYEAFGTRREKTVEVLRTLGTSVLMGGISTLLGTVPLAFTSSEVFRTVFYAFLTLVLLGITHSLILLPVILATIGPQDRKVDATPTAEVGPSDSTIDEYCDDQISI